MFSRPLTGKTVLFLLLAFFGVVVGVNMTMMKLAINTLPGTEVDSAYSASLAYTSEINAARNQFERHWSVEARLTRLAEGSATLTLVANDDQGKPLRDVEFNGRLERPTDKRGDRRIVLARAGEGTFFGKILDVSAGQWDLVIEGDTGGQRVFLSKNRVVLN
ncbi:MAG: FixH family protein [Rhizobiales bacterium]|nr:FixH family protein [Hyphomicrobiales bacterium]